MVTHPIACSGEHTPVDYHKRYETLYKDATLLWVFTGPKNPNNHGEPLTSSDHPTPLFCLSDFYSFFEHRYLPHTVDHTTKLTWFKRNWTNLTLVLLHEDQKGNSTKFYLFMRRLEKNCCPSITAIHFALLLIQLFSPRQKWSLVLAAVCLMAAPSTQDSVKCADDVSSQCPPPNYTGGKYIPLHVLAFSSNQTFFRTKVN